MALLGVGMRSGLRASSRILPLSAFKGAYLRNWGPLASHC